MPPSGYHSEVSPPKSNSQSAVGWLRDSIRNRGVMGTLRYYLYEFVDLLRDLTPSAASLATATSTSTSITASIQPGPQCRCTRVSASGFPAASINLPSLHLSQMITRFRLFSLDGFTFIDLGSGKGRTLLMASDYPFRRIIGLELLEELRRSRFTTLSAIAVIGRNAS